MYINKKKTLSPFQIKAHLHCWNPLIRPNVFDCATEFNKMTDNVMTVVCDTLCTTIHTRMPNQIQYPRNDLHRPTIKAFKKTKNKHDWRMRTMLNLWVRRWSTASWVKSITSPPQVRMVPMSFDLKPNPPFSMLVDAHIGNNTRIKGWENGLPSPYNIYLHKTAFQMHS